MPEVVVLPSGKALNAARALRALGNPVKVISILAGFSGAWIREQLIQYGIEALDVKMPGENRLAYSVYDPQSAQLTELIEDTDGPFPREAWDQLFELVCSESMDAAAVVLSGRGPTGFPDFAYKAVIDQMKAMKIPTFLDSYGPLLHEAIKGSPFLVKINQSELGGLLSRKVDSKDDCLIAATSLLKYDIEHIIITTGKSGSYLVNRNGAWAASVPEVDGAAIGSGDAMMAGVVHAFLHEFSLIDALRYGAAVGTANVKIPGACLFLDEDIQEVIKGITITRIPMNTDVDQANMLQ